MNDELIYESLLELIEKVEATPKPLYFMVYDRDLVALKIPKEKRFDSLIQKQADALELMAVNKNIQIVMLDTTETNQFFELISR